MARSRKVGSHAEYARWFASQGGKARKEALTPKQRSASARKAVLSRYKAMTREERRELARKAARARWAKARKAARAR
jgi:hypothetical protein